MTFEHEISAYFVEVESSYSCGMDGILAPAGSLLGLDVSAKNQLEQQQQNLLFMHMQCSPTTDSNPQLESQFP